MVPDIRIQTGGCGFEIRGNKLPYATTKHYTVRYYAPVAFPKIYLGKFWRKTNSTNFEHMTHYDAICHVTKISKF